MIKDVKGNSIYQQIIKRNSKNIQRESSENLLTIYDQKFTKYVTGSSFAGERSQFNMHGKGTYVFPHGVEYKGEFKDGLFHGKGRLKYPNGQTLAGLWKDGQLVKWNVAFQETDMWNLDTYCKQPDRRFCCSLRNGLKGAPMENLTDEQPSKPRPKDCFDVGDGFYYKSTKWVHSPNDFLKALYTPKEKNKTIDMPDETTFIKKFPLLPVYQDYQWIKNTCRKTWDESTGYKPHFYEVWTSGRKSEAKDVARKVKEIADLKMEVSPCDDFLRLLKKNCKMI